MRSRAGVALTAAITLTAGTSGLAQDQAASAAALGTLPIRDVTVFKDGHAFVLREGEMPVDAAGNVLVDDLPRPVLGTFWPYCADPRAKLAGVVAGTRRVAVDRTALVVADLLRANVGAEATFLEVNGARWSGRIVGFPERASAEIAATSPPGAAGDALPQLGDVMLVDTAEGTRAVAVARIEGVTFKGPCRSGVRSEESRGLLTLRLDWQRERAASARVGMVYLERGLRWIPEYRIEIDGAGRANVRLQATLVNDLADLDRAAVHLVVGVPKFDFAETLDPMALGADAAEVAARSQRNSRFVYALSNSIQTQAFAPVDADAPASSGDAGALAAGVAGAGANEDLFVFDLKDVSLRRGERMTVPVAEFEIPYSDVYAVDVPVAPPLEIWRAARNPDELQRAREMARPVAMHKIRLLDTSPFPLTTAPAVVVRDGRILGQGRTTYTSPGAKCDVAVTQAIGLRVKRDEHESNRTPSALRWRGDDYGRVDLAGTLTLANDADRAYDVEVTRHVLGAVDTADHGGVVTAIGVLDDALALDAGVRPAWWGWFDWPWWWSQLNGVGRVTWKVRVEPRTSAELTYAWHYFWR